MYEIVEHIANLFRGFGDVNSLTYVTYFQMLYLSVNIDELYRCIF